MGLKCPSRQSLPLNKRRKMRTQSGRFGGYRRTGEDLKKNSGSCIQFEIHRENQLNPFSFVSLQDG
jgi:hypothetical protein